MIGRSLSHYRIIAELGAGGMGVVYRAHDEQLDRDVAIKVLPHEMASDTDRLTRFEHEARAIARLAHPNILQVYELGQHEGRSFMVTELLEGETLRERLEGGGSLGWRQAAKIGAAIADGLAAAHQAGIVHRDLKPSNVFLTSDGRVKVLDFGLARTLDVLGSNDSDAPTLTRCTAAGAVLGTVGYMSPEQVRGELADGRSDIFSLGCVLYEMISGSRAFYRETGVETMNAILKEEPAGVALPEVGAPPELASITRRCMEKQPEARFQSASDLAYNLRSISSASEPRVKPERPRGMMRLKPALRLPLLAVVAAVVGVAVWAWLRDTPAPAPELVPNRVAVAPLENRTGDPARDHIGLMAAEAVVQRFAETGAAETVILPRFTDDNSSGTHHERLIEQARRADAGLLLSGAYYAEGNAMRIKAQLTEPATGEFIYTFEAEAAGANPATAGADELGEKVVAAVAFHRSEGNDITLLRPPSCYAAFQAYQRCLEFWGSDYDAAISQAQRALELDPDFHYMRLLIPAVYGNTGDYKKAQEAVALAEVYVDQFTEFERSLFRARKASAFGDHVALMIEYRRLVKLAPNLSWVRYNWGDAALGANRPREAIEALTPILASWTPEYLPYAWWPFQIIADAHHLLGEYELELKHVEFGLQKFPDTGQLYRCKASALAAMGRPDLVQDVIDDCLRTPLRSYNPGQIMVSAASELRYHGETEASLVMARQAISWYERQATGTGAEPMSHTDVWTLAGALRLAGQWERARNLLTTVAADNWHPVDVAGALGVIAARLGEREEADRIFAQLPTTDEYYAQGIRLYWQACITAHMGKKEVAVALLREAFSKGLPSQVWTDDNVVDYDWRPRSDLNLEPLWHYPPFEELVKPRG